MHIETSGSGPNLILIHGWAMHGGIFAPLTPLLAERFRVHVVDLPGHGYSSESQDSIDPARCAAWIAAQLPPAIWVGWSFGGLVSLLAAFEQPQQVRGIVEIATSPKLVAGPGWAHGVAAQIFVDFGAGLLADYRATIERFLALETLGSAQGHDELRSLKARVFERGDPALPALEHGLDVLRSTDLRARLPVLALPNLWIAGRRDRLVPPAATRWAAQHSPRGEFLEIASGHAPFLSHAQQVADAIVAFAERIPDR
ncbi:MAG TPA: pimeloyl-ACP methyl ester esterase BioH [Rhodanobacteraceae bacterium]|nr:pimeloyl-ACP methyl ester esterase BioH [Rhodanobacteraceae bacterium]